MVYVVIFNGWLVCFDFWLVGKVIVCLGRFDFDGDCVWFFFCVFVFCMGKDVFGVGC